MIGNPAKPSLRPLASAGAAALALAAPAAAHAGGLFIPGMGPIAQSRAGAYVATADDPSALAVNPAGLAKGHGVELLLGANLVDFTLEFHRRGSYDQIDNVDLAWEGQRYPSVRDESSPAIGVGPFQAVPMIVATFDLRAVAPGLRVAAGVFAPTAYPTRKIGADYEFDDPNTPPPPSRYDIISQEAAVVMPSVGVGYRVTDQLDVGGRFTWGIADLKATTVVWGQLNYQEWTGYDALFDVDASDGFVPMFGLGALYRPTDQIELGLSWDSQANVHARGEGHSIPGGGLEITPGEPLVIEPVPDERARCAPGGRIGALKACVDIGLPMVTTVGGRYKFRGADGTVQGDVEVNVAWERWSAVSDHTVVVDGQALGLVLNRSQIRHNFDDTFSFRVGGGWRVPVGTAAVALRAGVAHDTAAVPENWERLDIDGAARTTIAAGASYVTPKLEVHVGGGFVHEGTRDVGTDCNTSVAMQACDGTNRTTPLGERVGPDPVQPLNAGAPFESPFNAGEYRSSYLLLHLGVTARF